MFANFYLFSGEMVYNDPMRRVIFIFIDGAGVGQADAGNPFFRRKPFGEAAIRAEKALYQDYSNRQLIAQGLELPEYSPAQAAAIIANAALDYEFILYEYFQTDIYAHRRSFANCVDLIRDLDTLIENLLARLDKKQDTLVLTSDHGNLEDFHSRGHSRNPVPLLAWGRHGEFLRAKIKSLSDVTPAILELY